MVSRASDVSVQYSRPQFVKFKVKLCSENVCITGQWFHREVSLFSRENEMIASDSYMSRFYLHVCPQTKPLPLFFDIMYLFR